MKTLNSINIVQLTAAAKSIRSWINPNLEPPLEVRDDPPGAIMGPVDEIE